MLRLHQRLLDLRVLDRGNEDLVVLLAAQKDLGYRFSIDPPASIAGPVADGRLGLWPTRERGWQLERQMLRRRNARLKLNA